MTSLSTQGRNPLLIPDTLQSILDCIPQDPDVERQQTLFALAQTCRSTSEPSLDRLWRKLRSLHPLIRCARPIERNDQDVEQNDQDAKGMKQNTEDDDDNNEEEDENSEKDDQASEGDAEEVEDSEEDADLEEGDNSEEDKDSEDEEKDSELEELDPPTPAEWAVIERYSHRVQELTLLEDDLSLSFLKSVGSQPSSPLFPNLRVLTWHWESNYPRPGSIAWIYPLLSPTLVELRALLTDTDGETLRSFLQRYPHYCRNLKTVAFTFPSDQAVAQTTTYELSRAVCSHDKIVYLRLFNAPIDDDAMRQLSLSPMIESLSVYHYPQKPIPRPYFQAEDTSFPRARILQLTTSDLDFFTTLLGSRDQTFSTLFVEVREQPTAKALSTFFSMLASSSSYTESIQTLVFAEMPIPLVGESRAEEEPHVFHLSYQSLLPLMSFSHLHTLQVTWSDQISLDDNEFAHLARSWPSMEILKICSKRGEYPPQSMKYITCEGLLQLIVACPKLREFCLPLDAREVPTDTDPDVRNTAIRHLCFHEPHISDPSEVASFLRKHFPSASSVAAKFSGPAIDYDLWLEVDDLVW